MSRYIGDFPGTQEPLSRPKSAMLLLVSFQIQSPSSRKLRRYIPGACEIGDSSMVGQGTADAECQYSRSSSHAPGQKRSDQEDETQGHRGWLPASTSGFISYAIYSICIYIYIYIEREHITHHVFLGIPLYSPAFKSGLGPIWATVGRLSRRDTYNTWLWTGVRHFPAWVESPRHRDLR